MKQSAAKLYLATVVIFRRNGKIAFVLRQNTGWMDGYYGLPGGKVEAGESFLAAAIREAQEEVGLALHAEDLRHVLTAHRNSGDSVWVDLFFEADGWQGELQNAEPHKHASLDWLDPDALPDNVIPSGRYCLDQIKAGQRYAEYGWKGERDD